MKPKAYSYVRFSSPEQAKGDSLRRQMRLTEEYVLRHGLELDTDLTFQDRGLSAYHGANLSVGRLGEFKRAVEDGMVPAGSFLLVENLDRVSRQSARKAVRTLEDICELGITVVTLSDGKAYTTESLDGIDFILSVVMFMRSHEESELKSSRLKSAWQNRRECIADKPLTACCPAWLRLVEGRFEVIKKHVAIIRRIFDDYIKGHGLTDITARLNREGVPVISRGAKWHRTYIKDLLSNGSVIGTLTPHCIVRAGARLHQIPLDPVKGYYPAVIPLKLYDRAQQIQLIYLKSHNPISMQNNILAYVTKCTICGSLMGRYVHSRQGRIYIICDKAKNGESCGQRFFSFKRLESVFLNVLRESLFSFPDVSEQTTDVDECLFKLRQKLNVLKTDKASLLIEIEVIGNSYSLRNATLVQQLVKLVKEIKTVELKIANILIENKESSPDMVDMIRKELIEEMINKRLSIKRLNLLIRGLFDKVELYKEDKRNVRFVATYKAGPVLECHYDDDSYQWRYLE